MALINCPECGKQISDKATKCIHCGYPVNPANLQNRVEPIESTVKRKSYFKYIIAFVAFLVVLILVLSIGEDPGKNDSEYAGKLIGNWVLKYKITLSEMAQSSDLQLPKGMDGIFDIKDYTSYNNDGTWQSAGTASITKIVDGIPKTMNLSLDSEGTWQINNGELIETTKYNSAAPVDAASQNIIEEKDEFFSVFLKSDVGEIINTKIVDISDDTMVLEYADDEFDSKIKVTAKKTTYNNSNKRYGKLRVKYPNGGWYNYDGGIINNLPDGYGTALFDNGDNYKGYFSKGKFHGSGKYTRQDGYVYDGHWQNWIKNGYGTETYLSGDQYKGVFKNDLRDGYGTYTWKNGSKYTGNWKNHKRHGYGTMYNSNGSIRLRGQWVNDVYQN